MSARRVRRRRERIHGTILVGSGDRRRELTIGDELAAALLMQRQMFRAKFGRDPGPDDPVIFDPDCDEPRNLLPEKWDKMMREITTKADLPPEIVYAQSKTGLLVTEANYSLLLPGDRIAWNEAIAEYHALAETQRA